MIKKNDLMPEISSPKPKLALSGLIFGHFLNHFYAYVLGASMVIIRLPTEINLTDSQVGLIGTFQMIIFAIFSIAVGVISDKWMKSKEIFIPIGVLFMSLHLFIAALAKSAMLLIISAVIVGFGASFYHPVAYASIADLYEEKKGLTMALNAALGMIGTSITPGLVVSFDRLMGWRNFFYLFGGVGVVLAIGTYFLFRHLIDYRFTAEEIKQKNHRKETMKKEERVKYWFKTELVVILSVAVITCLLYSSFRSGIFKINNQFLSIMFVDYYKYPEFSAGWITTIILVIGGLTAILGGILSDKYATSITMLISLGGSTILLLIIFLVSPNISGITAIILFFIFIALLYLSAAAGTKYVAENVPQGSRSTGISLLFAFPNIIAGLFPWIFGSIKDSFDKVNNFTSYWAIGFLCLLAAFGSLMSLILFIRDMKLGKIPFRSKLKTKVLMTTDEI